jgi:hypothetical protein
MIPTTIRAMGTIQEAEAAGYLVTLSSDSGRLYQEWWSHCQRSKRPFIAVRLCSRWASLCLLTPTKTTLTPEQQRAIRVALKVAADRAYDAGARNIVMGISATTAHLNHARFEDAAELAEVLVHETNPVEVFVQETNPVP